MNPISATVVTGMSPLPFLAEFLGKLSEKTGTLLEAAAVPNQLFGETVTVTGLVAGRDIADALSDRNTGDVIVIPDVMLKEGEGIFLDDMTVQDLQSALKKEVVVVESTPWGIYSMLSERCGVL